MQPEPGKMIRLIGGDALLGTHDPATTERVMSQQEGARRREFRMYSPPRRQAKPRHLHRYPAGQRPSTAKYKQGCLSSTCASEHRKYEGVAADPGLRRLAPLPAPPALGARSAERRSPGYCNGKAPCPRSCNGKATGKGTFKGTLPQQPDQNNNAERKQRARPASQSS